MIESSEDESGEDRWLSEVYQRGAKQLTARSVAVGMAVGMVMCLSNLYVVLKTGWSMGVTITACILAWALFRGLQAVRLAKSEFTILENNAMSSVASAAGYMTGGGNMAAVPALFMLTGSLPGTGWLILWLAVIALLGVFAAIPIKRQLINRKALPFPSGTATAETLRALHARVEGGGSKQARRLFGAALLSALVAWLRDARASWMPLHLPSHFGFPFSIGGRSAVDFTLGVEGSLLLFGGGALMSFRTGWSMALGGVTAFGILAPMMVEQGVVAEVTYRSIVQWTLWPGAAILISSGLLSFALEWRMIAKSFQGLAGLVRRSSPREDDPLRDVECPQEWFVIGFLVFSPIVVFLMIHLFGVPWWAAIAAIPLALVMGVVAARVTGETDITPTKALGPVTQLIYGGLVPGSIPVNVMSANVTGGIGLHAADLLTDLKAGYILGANPRQQFYAQLFGVVAGAAVVVPVFNLLIPTPEHLGSSVFPAPGVQVWAGVAKVLSVGIGSLDPSGRVAAAVGAVVGVALTLIDRFSSPRIRRFVPTASGLGIAFVIPAYNSLMFALGATWAEIMRARYGKTADETTFPVGSGLIAGESLMGVFVATLTALGFLGL